MRVTTKVAATPKFTSYGEFRKSELFHRLFPVDEFESGQATAAKRVVARILGNCDGRHAFPRIETIVDLGCGDGSLLRAIEELLRGLPPDNDSQEGDSQEDDSKEDEHSSRDKRWPPPQGFALLGIDTCGEMIARAGAAVPPAGSRVRFFHDERGDGLELRILRDLQDAKELHWDTTAVLCQGHTWFHILEQDRLLAQIRDKRPAVLLVDIFRTWDRVIERLTGPDKAAAGKAARRAAVDQLVLGDQTLRLGEFKDEEVRLVDDAAYSLRTQLIVEPRSSPPQVVRGIYERSADSASVGHWLFATRQVAISSQSLRTSEAGEGSRFPVAVKGEDPVAVASRTLEYAKSPEAGSVTGGCDYVVLREFGHESGWGDMHCIAFAALSPEARDLNEAYFKAVANLVNHVFLDAKGEKHYGSLRKLTEMFSKGEVAVIMPFDPLRVFARMVPLKAAQMASGDGVSGDVAKLLSTCDLILEHPNYWQRRYATAYSLYHTLLDMVSSPVGFLLRQVPEYEQAPVDVAFDALETALLKATAPGQKLGRGFFIVPFYFGSLPLFVLILEEPQQLPLSATNAQVYSSLAQNLDRQMHVVIRAEEIRSRVIAPVVADIVAARPALTVIDKDGQSRLEGAVKAAMEARAWKSWITALPSHPLKSLDATKSRNLKLWRMLSDECDRVYRDAPYQISQWFEDGDFFRKQEDRLATGDGHVGVVPKVHAARLDRMYRDCGLQNKPPTARDLEGLPYFRQVNRFAPQWLKFTAERLASLDAGCRAGRTASEQCRQDFDMLKRVFCRSKGNTGSWFRFSFSRLWVVAAVEAGSLAPDVLDAGFAYLRDFEDANGAHGLGVFRARSEVAGAADPVTEIGHCARFLGGVGVRELRMEKLDARTVARGGKKLVVATMTLAFEIANPIQERGADYLDFHKRVSPGAPPLSSAATGWPFRITAEREISPRDEETFVVEWKVE
jgi:SAM-dependent methyltransferase